jgi:hypothetical protein
LPLYLPQRARPSASNADSADFHFATLGKRSSDVEQHDMATTGLKYQRLVGRDVDRCELRHAALIPLCNDFMHFCAIAYIATH